MPAPPWAPQSANIIPPARAGLTSGPAPASPPAVSAGHGDATPTRTIASLSHTRNIALHLPLSTTPRPVEEPKCPLS